MSNTRTDRSHLTLVPTGGRGNCAFRAFIRSLLDLIQQIDQQAARSSVAPDEAYPDFIAWAGEALGVTQTWESVSTAISRLGASDPDMLETLLEQTLRNIAIEYARSQNKFKLRTQQSIAAAFSDYVYESLGLPTGKVTDDIYTRHEFVQTTFHALAQEVVTALQTKGISLENRRADNSLPPAVEDELDEMIEQVVTIWWNVPDATSSKAGYDLFLDAMKEDGQLAGDFELAALGGYFGADIEIFNDAENTSHHIPVNADPAPEVEGMEDGASSNTHPVVTLHYDSEAVHWSCMLPTTDVSRVATLADEENSKPRAVSNWVAQTIWSLRQGRPEMQPSRAKWDDFVSNKLDEAAQPVDKAAQLAIDKEFALRLQQAEYQLATKKDLDFIVERQLQMEEDEALARSLQAEEEAAAYRWTSR